MSTQEQFSSSPSYFCLTNCSQPQKSVCFKRTKGTKQDILLHLEKLILTGLCLHPFILFIIEGSCTAIKSTNEEMLSSTSSEAHLLLKAIFPVSPSHCQVPPASCALWKASLFHFAQLHSLKFYCAELDQAQVPKYQFEHRSRA